MLRYLWTHYMLESILALLGSGGSIWATIWAARRYAIPFGQNLGRVWRALKREFLPSDPKVGNGSIRDHVVRQGEQLADLQSTVARGLVVQSEMALQVGEVKVSNEALHTRVDIIAKQFKSHIDAWPTEEGGHDHDHKAEARAEVQAKVEMKRGAGREVPRGHTPPVYPEADLIIDLTTAPPPPADDEEDE